TSTGGTISDDLQEHAGSVSGNTCAANTLVVDSTSGTWYRCNSSNQYAAIPAPATTGGSVILYNHAGNTDTVTCPTNSNANFATTYTIPANMLSSVVSGTTGIVRVFLGFKYTASPTVPSMGITVKLGSTVIYSAYGAAPGAAATNLSFGLMVTLQPDNTPGSSVNVYTNPLPGATVVSSV